ncbi:MAG TPA: nucleotidyl transferase AbiEii/AbiGii toxin family protein [Polyangiaceae bacterium]
MVIDAAGLSRALRDVASDLTALGRNFALVGGLAVSARAEIRFTRDVDLAVAVTDDADAERLILALKGLSYQIRATVEQDAVGRLATVRLLSPAEVKVDLLFASSGLEAETVARAEWVEQGTGKLPVARAEELVAMKVLSADERRLQDHLDFRSLITVGSVDLDTVRSNLELIETRGFARMQDLQAKLELMLAAVPI